MTELRFRDLQTEDLHENLLEPFVRHQQVTKCWRKENGSWVLKRIPFVEEWDADEKRLIIKELMHTALSGGIVTGCFQDDALVGFGAVERHPFGSEKQYLQLSQLHVSCPFRGHGIGRQLFSRLSFSARALGAQKLYISAHSSEESQAFYRIIGCADAAEINSFLADKEPCDCQLEYLL